MPGGLAPDGVFRHRQQGLLQVLKAYTLYRPEQGYCQAQGPVAAVLLMHLPPEVSALSPWQGPQTQTPTPRNSDFSYLRPWTPNSSDLGAKATCALDRDHPPVPRNSGLWDLGSSSPTQTCPSEPGPHDCQPQ